MAFNFGQTTAPSTGFGFGFGTPSTGNATTQQPQPQQQQQQPQQLDFRTPFDQVPQQLREQMEKFEKQKEEEKKQLRDLMVDKPTSKNMTTITEEMKKLERKYASIVYAFRKDLEAVKKLSEDVKDEANWVETSQNNWSRIRSTHFLGDTAYRPIYFQQAAKKLDHRMQELWHQIEELGNTLTRAEKYAQPGQILQETLKNQQELLLNISARVATIHEQCTELRELYTKRIRTQTEHVFEAQKPSNFNDDILSHDYIKKLLGLGSRPTAQQNITLPGMQPENVQLQISQQQQQPSGFGFGGFGSSTTQPSTTGGFNFGSTPSATTNTGFNFGSTTTQPTTTGTSGFGFGTPSTGGTTGGGGGFSFGTTDASTGGGGFGFGTVSNLESGATTSTPNLKAPPSNRRRTAIS